MGKEFRKTCGLLILLGISPDAMFGAREEFDKKCQELPENQENLLDDPDGNPVPGFNVRGD